jgi:dimethylglycine dehydrogenase
MLLGVYSKLIEAGEAFGLGHFGLFATESMRLEKSYRHWKADLITEFNPFESGLSRFVKLEKDFVGKPALLAQKEKGLRRDFVTLEVHTKDGPPHGGDSLVVDGKVVGTISSSAWGYRVNKNLAMAFIDPALAKTGTRLGVHYLGSFYDATVTTECQYDPANTRMRA